MFFSAVALAAAPHGNLDAADADRIGGWARDPDWPAPIAVHIYIDGEIAHGMSADALRTDLPYADQDHGYTWVPPLLGPGPHEVIAYAIGVDSTGNPDGENIALSGSPTSMDAGCAGFQQPALDWCNGVPAYYRDRAADTEYLFNDRIRVGVNGSYGGAVLELYGADHSTNLLAEHGGGAVQLSVWGYEEKGANGWFGTGDGVCDPTSYASEGQCLAQHATCQIWCCDEGAHVTDCSTVKSCVGWGAGAPLNPIQAQARDCGWDSDTNDVDTLTRSEDSVTTRKSAPWHFTQTDAMEGMVFEQTTTLHDAYVQLDYRVTYSGPYTLSNHPQEIPAVFPGVGMNHSYWFYTGDAPYSGGAVRSSIGAADGPMLRFEGRGPYPHPNHDEVVTEHWVSVCDSAGAHCLTLATFSELYKEVDCAGTPWLGYGYMTPLGGFNIEPGMDVSVRAFLFPGRYDEVLEGRTVRDWIYELAKTELPETPVDTDGPGETDIPSETDSPPDSPQDDSEPEGESADPVDPPGGTARLDRCGCSSPGGGGLLLLLPLLLARRRRTEGQDSGSTARKWMARPRSEG